MAMQNALRSAALRLAGQNFLGSQMGATYSLVQNLSSYVS